MESKTVIYIDRNFIDERYPNKPEDGIGFFTYGWSSLCARMFKKYCPDWTVEVWKSDSRIRAIISNEFQGVKHTMFPAINFGRFGQFSFSMINHLQQFKNHNKKVLFNVASFDHLLFHTLSPFLKNVPLVVQNHGEATSKYKRRIKKGYKKFYHFLRSGIESYSFRAIDLLYILDKRLEPYTYKTFKGEIKIQGTGVDESLFYPIEKDIAKRELGLDITKKYLLYIGRLNYTKHPDILIDVFNELKKERDDVGLLLVGHEKTDPLYKIGLESGAIMFGVVLQTEISKFISASEIYVLPKYIENNTFGGIGMLPVQAMFCNIPVIGDSLRNFPEEDLTESGQIANDRVTIKSAIVDVIENKRNYQHMRKKAIKYFCWKNISEKTAEDYSNLLQQARNEILLHNSKTL